MLLGENGAGKSTLVKVLSGAVRKDRGEIRLGGTPVEIAGPHHARRLGISVIYQELMLVPHLSVAENVYLGKAPRRWGVVDWRRMRADAARLLTGLGLTLDVSRPVGELGLAQQQMVEVARALTDEARVLVMDEPTSALSGTEVEQLFATIARLTARGVGVVYISHRMDEVFRIGQRVTVLRDGRHVATRPLSEVSAGELVRLMANRDLAEQYPPRAVARATGAAPGTAAQSPWRAPRHRFTLHAGEIVGLAGLVGAGRTELARAITGADAIDAGRDCRPGPRRPHPDAGRGRPPGVRLPPGGSQDARSRAAALGAAERRAAEPAPAVARRASSTGGASAPPPRG